MMRPALLACAISALSAVTGCDREPPLAVARVDLSRFEGKWFEIAKLPRATESGCEGTVAFYRLTAPDELAVSSECRQEGSVRTMNATALVSDRDTPGKLSLDVGGFYGDYWILEVGSHYEYAVVGHPTREYLWILSRTPALAEDVQRGIVERAHANAFDVSRLEYTVQP